MSKTGDQDIVRFGIIGCARIARKLCRAIKLSPNAAVVAVGSRSLEKSRLFISVNGLDPAVVSAYGTYDEVLADSRVDAVYLPLPTSLHLRWAVAAAEHRKHVLLEKPPALCAADLERILAACAAAGVQFMDSTMWMHHPRTAAMKGLLSDPARFGQLRTVDSIFTFMSDPDFLENDIRVKPDLDGLGCLGDLGWYCIRAILWAVDFELPYSVAALRHSITNPAGVLISCSASLSWNDGRSATFHCSFLAHLTMELAVVGTVGTLHAADYVIPADEASAAFSFTSGSRLINLDTAWAATPSRHLVSAELPQEALMVVEFSRLVAGVRGLGWSPENKWPEMTRKTQLVIDAVKASVDRGFEPVDLSTI